MRTLRVFVSRLLNRWIFCGLICGGSLVATATANPFVVNENDLQRIGKSEEWLRLLHFRDPWFHSPRSDVDSPAFFLAERGRTLALDELRETVAVSLNPERAKATHGTFRQPAICAYPARLEFLKRAIGPAYAARVIEIPCDDFQKWSAGIRATGVSVVFSAAYPGNPASMFGHTLLRLDRKKAADRDLLNYGVNFSASVPAQENPVKYALSGLIGGYTGRYDLSPYYQKVNEYSFAESRDLWEYRLSLSPDETAQLVRHLWELYSDGFFDYYFLDENCSYQILTALEAVRPDWRLSAGFILSVLPVETLRQLRSNEGAITEVHRRLSLRNRMQRAVDSLSPAEGSRLSELYTGKTEVQADDSVATLDALIVALNYRKQSGNFGRAHQERLRSALVARSQRKSTTREDVEMENDLGDLVDSPEKAHRSSRLGLRGGTQAKRGILKLALSALEHDFLDRTPAYNSFSEVRLLKAEIEHRGDWRLSEATLIGMSSYGTYSNYAPQKSWRISTGWTRPNLWNLRGAYGLGTSMIRPENLIYALAAGEIEVGRSLQNNVRVSPGLELGLLYAMVPERLTFHLHSSIFWDANASGNRRMRWQWEGVAGLSVSQKFSMRMLARRVSSTSTASSPENEFLFGPNAMF